MNIPIIAIVGRPNVGKSTLFNRVIGEKRAIVEDTPGVTRDRNYALVERFSIPFYFVDTGGYEKNPEGPLQNFVAEQTRIAIDEAEIIFCVFDGNVGVQPGDQEMVEMLRRSNKDVRYLVNKCDGEEQSLKVLDFYSLGLTDCRDISARYGRAVNAVIEDALRSLPIYGEAKQRVKEVKEKKEREREEAELEIERQLALLPEDDDLVEGDEEEFEFKDDEEPNFAPVYLPEESIESEKEYLREHKIISIKKADLGRMESKGEPEVLEEQADLAPELIKVAIVGRPNVGKSTLFNRLVGSERAITSPLAGTTRDSVDTPLRRDGQNYLLVDTAGLRKKARITDNIEHYSTLRALKSLAEADVCVVVIDALDGATEQDAKIVGLAHEHGLGIVVCVNKWDLLEKNHKTVKEYSLKVQEVFKFAKYAPIVFTSALSGKRCPRIIDTVKEIAIQRSKRIPTAQLNRVLTKAHQRATAPTYRGNLLKFYFAAQIATAPPRFTLFFNFSRGIHFSYLRSLKNSIREEFGFIGTDLKLIVRKRKKVK